MKHQIWVARRAFIIAEPFPYEGISTRKLVLESAYYNVITAYSVDELLNSVDRFPEIDAVVVHGELPGYSREAMKAVRDQVRDKPIMFLTSTGHQSEDNADVVLSSHDPQVLLGKLQEYFGPADTREVTRKRRA
jgi:hypothetical protein